MSAEQGVFRFNRCGWLSRQGGDWHRNDITKRAVQAAAGRITIFLLFAAGLLFRAGSMRGLCRLIATTHTLFRCCADRCGQRNEFRCIQYQAKE